MDELLHFYLYVRQTQTQGVTEQSISFSHMELYQIICKEKIHTAFPNVEAILRLFLSLMVTNCSGERSFSRLKRIKNELRSTMSDERLSALSILRIESDKLKQINFDKPLHDFVLTKARKKLSKSNLTLFDGCISSFKLCIYYNRCLNKKIKI